MDPYGIEVMKKQKVSTRKKIVEFNPDLAQAKANTNQC